VSDETPVSTGKIMDSRSPEAVVRENIDGIYALMFRMLGHREVFVRALRALPSFRGAAKTSTWIYRIAINVGRDAIAARQGDRRRDGGEVDPERCSSPANPDRDLIDDEERRILVVAMAGIADDKREMILLSNMEGLSQEAIAEALGVPEGTVKSRLHRARAALRAEVRRLMGEKA
jgi:RNA polymerase sigma-70 factor (ECF subfamily)